MSLFRMFKAALRLPHPSCKGAFHCAALVLLLPASAVMAGEFDYGLRAIPDPPQGGQVFQIAIDTGFCDIFPGGLQSRDVVLLPGTIRVVVQRDTQGICNAPSIVRTWEIGPVAPGNYHLELIGYEGNLPETAEELDAIDFVVLAPPPRALPSIVPATRPTALLAMVIVMLGFAMFRLRRLI